ncbi:Acyl-coenzyme A thioesterase THEM4 [Pseudocercospora fuligena]|uniref:Acyl-coenzyme A thioesterase THEM4 n=1 Tax=Pseudocercospora fuligena TaxID=685502 RepID=A0A8H6RK14_9PEZI|nr:Acyl-coenzyme A thioesterase THEM4 [Pseudocercospora fuligena]
MADWREGDYYAQLRAASVSPKELQYFQSQPSTKSWLEHTDYSPVASPQRTPRGDGEDEFLGRVVNTDDTIRHWLAVVSDKAFPLPGSKAPGGVQKDAGVDQPDFMLLCDLQHGVNGFREIAHGGFLCSLLDETLAQVVELHRHTGDSLSREYLYTANLNVNFRRPVATPDTIIIKGWLEKRAGRKWTVKGVLENSKAELCIDVDGLWIAARPEKL